MLNQDSAIVEMNYKPHEFAKIVGVTVKTLQRWDNSGKLPAKRTPSNYRYYTDDDLRIALGEKPRPSVRKVVVYCRVSSSNQRPELKNQIKAMEEFANNCGYCVTETISEIGGSLNFKRKEFMEMILSMLKGEIEVIVVAHKDRLCRFAFDFIEQLAIYSDCKIVVANQSSLSPESELKSDLITIIHYFSCRLYGLKRYTNRWKKEIEKAIDKPIDNQLECDQK
ncbi:MAG: IS607 family transposase [Nostocaceae cyanobacterium]|nr:IS607 family transposase [Nostocaceae cyanobacterium]